jgi:hypothetical protein
MNLQHLMSATYPAYNQNPASHGWTRVLGTISRAQMEQAYSRINPWARMEHSDRSRHTYRPTFTAPSQPPLVIAMLASKMSKLPQA